MSAFHCDAMMPPAMLLLFICFPQCFQASAHASVRAMQTDRFTSMSSNILGRIDELGTRIDELEKQIEDMMTQSGPNDGSPSKMGQH